MRLHSHQFGFFQGIVPNAQLELTQRWDFCHVFGLQFLHFHRLQCSLRLHSRSSHSLRSGPKRRQFLTLCRGDCKYTWQNLLRIHLRQTLDQQTLPLQHIFVHLWHFNGLIQPLGKLFRSSLFLCCLWNHFRCLCGLDFCGTCRSFGLG